MIWCVEDDASILDIEVYTLQSTGFQARGFADGTAFWSAIGTAQELPELVVLDVMLPGVDGVELLRRLRADTRLQGQQRVTGTVAAALAMGYRSRWTQPTIHRPAGRVERRGGSSQPPSRA